MKTNNKVMKHNEIRKLTLTSMLFAVGLVLPFFTGQIPQVGSMLLPMHIPVFLCGLICGWKHGLMIGLMLPVVRSFLFAMPPMYPTALAMAFELGTYGLVAGFVYFYKDYRCMKALLRSMVVAMIAGRIVWAFAMILLMGVSGDSFTWQAFIAGAFLNAVPGIMLQFVLIPAVMVALDRTHIVPFTHCERA